MSFIILITAGVINITILILFILSNTGYAILKIIVNFDPNSTTIIIALIGLLATVIGTIIWMLKWAVKNYGKDIQEHTRAANSLAAASLKMSKSVDRGVKSNNEVLIFMRNLNDKLTQSFETLKHKGS